MKKKYLKTIIAGTLSLVLLAGCAGSSGGTKGAIESAVYPKMAQYPGESESKYDAWRKSKEDLIAQPIDYYDGLNAFFADSLSTMLEGSQGENMVYSPTNIYMALSLLSEVTDGDSRQQVLSALHESDIESLRKDARNIWRANYCDDGAATSILGNSVWLSDGVKYKKDTLKSLAENYYTSSFSGQMGTSEYDEMLRKWINDQTGDLLKEQTQGLSFDKDTILGLVSTIYFRAKWDNQFSEEYNESGTFHGAKGDEDAEFMRHDWSNNYYWGDKFSAVCENLVDAGEMWFILPDEGVTFEELAQDTQLTQFLADPYSRENSKNVIVHLYLPKFDVSSDIDIMGKLQQLGITDISSPDKANFKPLTDDDVFLSNAQHAARVKIDEEGVEAAAFTEIQIAGAAEPPDEEIDFKLDRPFMFAITGNNFSPLFVGTVNHLG